MEKQILKAKQLVDNPAKGRKAKFTKSSGSNTLEINQKLIDKTQKLLGIKGYYTDLDEAIANNETIIDRYHELYRIEQNFRIAKSDLQTRPIFHFKEDPIKLHLLICFISLVVAKHIELSSNISIKEFIKECKKVVTSGRLLDKITNKELILKPEIPQDLTQIIHEFFLLT
ncbi:MAG: hypothetical protein UZ11_BCD004001059 [Bacteroidetes bacterium OLB11]|nr:MAG: hypothetical protein UZ11_BCD004001059 [Bacteroidetes bacterium OLB11]